MFTRLSLAALAVTLLALVAFFALSSEGTLSEREAFEKRLAEHPFAQREHMSHEELKAIPKTDRPDLAAEQDFLRTMDPETGTIPIEYLFEANRRATALKRGSGGPLVTEAWEERGPTNVGGRTRAIMFDPNDDDTTRVWAGGVAGGLWTTEDITDEDATWSSVNDFWSNLAISTLTYDPTDTQVFYAGTGEGWFNLDAVRGAGIFKSVDGGETWNLLESTSNSDFYHIQDLLVHPATGDVYAATREDGLQRSQDGGATWTKVLGISAGVPSNRATDLELGADGRIYAAFGIFSSGYVFASDSGDPESWTELSENEGFPSTGFYRVELATAPSDANVVYALLHDSSNNGAEGIYRSDDAGATWTAMSLPDPADSGQPEFTRGQAWYDLIIEVDPNDPDAVFTGGIDLYKSTDGGATWEQISDWTGSFGEPYVHADQHQILFRPGSSDEIIFGNDGGIYYTATGTQVQPEFIVRNAGYNVTQYYSGAIWPDTEGTQADVMLAGSQDNGTQRYDEPGLNETFEPLGGDGGFTFIDQSQPAIAIASTTRNRFRRSTNGGFTFNTTLINSSSGSFINPADYDDREDILYTNINASSIYRVTDVATSSPSLSTIDGAFLSTPTHLRVSPYAPEGTSTVFVGTSSGRVFRIANAESTPVIEELNTGDVTNGSVSCIEFGANEDHIIVTFSNYYSNPDNSRHIWETTDGGETWTAKDGNLPNIPVRWALFNPNDRRAAIIATEAGVWETLDFDADSPTWTPAPGFPTVRTDMLQVRSSDNRVMASTHGRGVFTAPFLQFPVSAEEGAVAAGTHTLEPAYPNPFASRANFGLQVDQAQNVRVEVYNTLGQRVATLHDGPVAADTPQRFTIEGANLASGTYLYVVTGETFRDEGRVTLVR